MFFKLIDGNNYFRRMLEADQTGLVHYNLYNEVELSTDPVIYVWDGFDSLKKRRSIFPEYKKNRKPVREDIYKSIDAFKELLLHSKAVQVSVPGYEADDVIATLAKTIAANGDQVGIYSNDYDYYQLCTDKNIFCGCKPKDDIKPQDVRLYKTWVGDPSDNIKGVPAFGEKSWKRRKGEISSLAKITSFARQISQGHDMEEYYKVEVDKLGLLPISRHWLLENPDKLVTYWRIVGFFNVPQDLIDANTIIGTSNKTAAHDLMEANLWLPTKGITSAVMGIGHGKVRTH